MNYLLTFVEGIVTFISPCVLPMLPVYVTYFAGDRENNQNRSLLMNSLGFVSGFTIVFTTLGILANQLTPFFTKHETVVNIVIGIVIILFGLNFIGIITIPFLNTNRGIKSTKKVKGFFSALLLGIVFAISWSPCAGPFLGAALSMAATTPGVERDVLQGALLLFTYSLGLGIPFILSAVFIDKLGGLFSAIKKHYRIITIISGSLLIVLGILIATGKLYTLFG